MIRRIRVASNHPLVDTIKEHGYNVVFQENFDGSPDYSTVVAEFPFSYPANTVVAKEMSAIQQLEVVRELQQNWSDNSVSCTVYYKKEELPAIKEYLATHYATGHKSLSFLLHSDHGFKQAPFEEISKEKYDEMIASTRLISGISFGVEDDATDCESGVCPVR